MPGKPGKRVIVEAEAEIVRRIFREYVAGRTPRDIALDLNRDKVKPPRGEFWSASTINGNRARGSGLLSNALLDGSLVWNKATLKKDLRTGKRVSRINPESEWQTTAVPHLRIIEAETFAAAQARLNERGHEVSAKARKPRHLLSGLLRCGCCGGAIVLKDRDSKRRRVYCSRMHQGGGCPNGRAYYIEEIERRVLNGLEAQKTRGPLSDFSRPMWRNASASRRPKKRSDNARKPASRKSCGSSTGCSNATSRAWRARKKPAPCWRTCGRNGSPQSRAGEPLSAR